MVILRGVTIISDGYRIHTGNDLDLVQEVKDIGNPAIQSYLVEIPGRNGLLNLTKGLSGKVCYKNREIQLKYIGEGNKTKQLEIVELLNHFHGDKVKLIDDDTPEYFYEGEMSIEPEFGYRYVSIKIKLNANPFRVRTDYLTREVELSEEETEIAITNEGQPVTPTIIVTDQAQIALRGRSYRLGAGTYDLHDAELTTGVNKYTVSGSGKLIIKYKEARI